MFGHFALFTRSRAVTFVSVVVALTFVSAANPAPTAGLGGSGTLATAGGSTSHRPSAIPAIKRAVPRQYHGRTQAVSADITRPIGRWNCCQIGQPISHQAAGGVQSNGYKPARQAENPQYQSNSGQYQDDELMLQIGIVLGLAYLGFLAIWFWATRLRPH